MDRLNRTCVKTREIICLLFKQSRAFFLPILQGLIGSGMGKGPALALLLAGPALSLPSMLVLRSIMGTKKTVVYVLLVIVMATLTGLLYGALF